MIAMARVDELRLMAKVANRRSTGQCATLNSATKDTIRQPRFYAWWRWLRL